MSSKKPKVARLELKPTQVNTGFAQGNFDPRTGVAGYTLAEPLATMRDIFYGGAQDYLDANLANQSLFGQNISNFGRQQFNRASQYDVPKMASDWYRQNQALLSEGRAAEEARLADTLFKTGTTGFGTGVQGGYVNPQQFALLKAREQANAQLGLQAEDRARAIQSNDLNNALSLFNAGQQVQTNPYRSAYDIFGLGTNIEGLGANVLNPVSQFANNQLQTQMAVQQNQQAINNAKASGGFGGGLLGGIASMGLNSFMGGFSNPLTSFGTSLGTNLFGNLFGNQASGNASPGIQLGWRG